MQGNKTMILKKKIKNQPTGSVVTEDEANTGPILDKKDIPKDEVESFNFYEYSYKLLSKKISFLFPRLGGLRTKILKSGIPAAAAAPAEATTTVLPWTRFVDSQCAAIQLVLVELLDRLVGIVVVRHLDEPTTAHRQGCRSSPFPFPQSPPLRPSGATAGGRFPHTRVGNVLPRRVRDKEGYGEGETFKIRPNHQKRWCPHPP